jgi:plasmid maintenance system killer protein
MTKYFTGTARTAQINLTKAAASDMRKDAEVLPAYFFSIWNADLDPFFSITIFATLAGN